LLSRLKFFASGEFSFSAGVQAIAHAEGTATVRPATGVEAFALTVWLPVFLAGVLEPHS
jgi:hypothetical protein